MTIKEIKKDLFTMPNDYALAHCISADFALGAGIAREFNKRFDCKQKLFSKFPNSWTYRWDKTQERYRGGCIRINMVWSLDPPYIFNLITKRNYWDKPTLTTMKNALLWMREQCEDIDVKKLAMPRIGCGLDRQNWTDVKALIEKVFADTDIEIVICNL